MTQQTDDKCRAVIYARVSSKEQEREGFSIPAQLDLLYDYARSKGFEVVQEFKDIETAKAAGRGEFNRMVEYIKEHAIQAILVEKTDRLYRNLADYVKLEELDLEIHLVKENEVISKESLSHAKFIHMIRVVMAKNYIDNLREEVTKGMHKKAATGVFPARAPFGYVNMLVDGKKVIVPDPDKAMAVRKMFEWYGTGRYGLPVITRMCADMGVRFRDSGGYLTLSAIHRILMNRFYYGEMVWGGKVYQGVHEPVISRELWDRCQQIRRGRRKSVAHQGKNKWAFQGMVRCGECGGMLTAERKKGKYVYYHCNQIGGVCRKEYVREEVIDRQFGAALGAIRMDEDVAEWISDALALSGREDREYRDQVAGKLLRRDRLLARRMEQMYVDKLDGKVPAGLFDSKYSEWDGERAKIAVKVKEIRDGTPNYVGAVKIIELVNKAAGLYFQQDVMERRRLLDFVLSNSTWQDGMLTPGYRKPFDVLAVANATHRQMDGVTVGDERFVGNWWRRRESNPRPESKIKDFLQA